MEKLSYEQMFPEAIARLEMLNLHPHILENFREGVLSKTDTNMTVVKLTDEEKALVDKFERETGNLVYYVIFSNSSMCGESYTFFFVSAYRDDWNIERECLQSSQPLVYVLNRENEMFSEFGSIEIERRNCVLIKK